ncbi:MAG: DUF3336 domain-containing protein, partial [Pseudomonadaceae bacterium]
MIKLMQRNQSKRLLKEMEQAETYEEWVELAAAYDHEMGLDEWKKDDACESYDFRAIRQRLDQVRDLRFRRDYPQLLF